MIRFLYYKKVGLQGVHAVRSWAKSETFCGVGFWPLNNDVWRISNRPAFDSDPCEQCRDAMEDDEK